MNELLVAEFKNICKDISDVDTRKKPFMHTNYFTFQNHEIHSWKFSSRSGINPPDAAPIVKLQTLNDIAEELYKAEQNLTEFFSRKIFPMVMERK